MSDFPTELSEQQILNRAFDKSTNRLQTTGGTGSSSNQVQGTAADNAAAVGNPVLTAGKYNSSAPTYDNGDVAVVQMDVNGNEKVREQYAPVAEDNTNGVIAGLMKPVAASAYAPSAYKQFGSVTKANIKASAGNVYALRVINSNAAARYLQLHNKATAPAAADTAQVSYLIPGGTAAVPGVLLLETTFFAPSEYFATGIGFAISTTAATFTDSATASEHDVAVRYV